MAEPHRMLAVRESTRDRVRELKGAKSYDQIVREWLRKYESEM